MDNKKLIKRNNEKWNREISEVIKYVDDLSLDAFVTEATRLQSIKIKLLQLIK